MKRHLNVWKVTIAAAIVAGVLALPASAASPYVGLAQSGPAFAINEFCVIPMTLATDAAVGTRFQSYSYRNSDYLISTGPAVYNTTSNWQQTTSFNIVVWHGLNTIWIAAPNGNISKSVTVNAVC